MTAQSTLVNRYRNLAASVYHADKPVGRSFGDVELYGALLRSTTGPVLEPAVGNGRVLIPLLEAGHEMVGTDPSPEMLELCRAECALRGLHPELATGRFETIVEEDRYAAVIIPAGSIQLISDPDMTRTALAAMQRALRPGGRLILDLDSLHALAASAPSARSWEYGDDTLTLTAITENVDVIEQTTLTQLRYDRWRGGALAESEMEHFELRFWGVNEMRLLLSAVGFEEVLVHADYRLGALPCPDTRSITFEARRP